MINTDKRDENYSHLWFSSTRQDQFAQHSIKYNCQVRQSAISSRRKSETW